MSHSSLTVANYFIRSPDRTMDLNPMKLQKLVYLSHGWNLALAGKPLINSSIKAWEFGPTIPDLYDRLKSYGNNNITTLITTFDYVDGEIREKIPAIEHDCDEYTLQLLDRILEVYGKFSPVQLSNFCHKEGSPWDSIFKISPRSWLETRDITIPDELIRDYFRKLIKPNGQADQVCSIPDAAQV